MCICIKSDRDIIRLANEFCYCRNDYNIDYIYKSPGYRTYINLGRIKSVLLLEIIIRRERFQLEWNMTIGAFFEIMKKYGFTVRMSGRVTHLEYPEYFEIKDENILLGRLFDVAIGNTRDFIGRKYGLK